MRGRREGLREDVAVVLSLRVKCLPHDAVWRTYRTFRKWALTGGRKEQAMGL